MIFHERCAGCHTLSYAAAEGSAIKPNDKEYKDGPNFDQRREDENSVLYAIENGGFSSGPMPQDIVVGQDAQDVAKFLSQVLRAARRRDERRARRVPCSI